MSREMGAAETAICIGFDAMRVALGLPTTTFTYEEVCRWLSLMEQQEEHPKGSSTKEGI